MESQCLLRGMSSMQLPENFSQLESFLWHTEASLGRMPLFLKRLHWELAEMTFIKKFSWMLT